MDESTGRLLKGRMHRPTHRTFSGEGTSQAADPYLGNNPFTLLSSARHALSGGGSACMAGRTLGAGSKTPGHRASAKLTQYQALGVIELVRVDC
jgi:hypothetical protein